MQVVKNKTGFFFCGMSPRKFIDEPIGHRVNNHGYYCTCNLRTLSKHVS